MVRLQGLQTYLAALGRQDCIKLWEDDEYDFEHMTEPLNIGRSSENANQWFDEIQKLQGDVHIRLGIFLPDGSVIGDVALQNLDWKNRACSIGCGIAKIENRRKGYATDATRTILQYGLYNLGLERISASTLEPNIGSRRALEKCGFTLEGIERKAVYFAGKRFDRLHFGLLRDEVDRR